MPLLCHYLWHKVACNNMDSLWAFRSVIYFSLESLECIMVVESAWVCARSKCLKLTRHQVCATRAAFKMGDMAWTFPDMGQHTSWCDISGQIDYCFVSWLDSYCWHLKMDWFVQFFLLRESSNLWSMVEHHNISKISVLRRDVSTSGMHFISPLWLYVSPSKHTCLLLYVVTMWFWLHVFYKSNYLNTSFSLFLTF